MGRQAFQDLLFSGVANKSWYDSIDIVANSDTLEDHWSRQKMTNQMVFTGLFLKTVYSNL